MNNPEIRTIWDPLRKKSVALTPEEKVRQWFISVLENQMQVPRHMMMSEVGFKLADKQMRSDILVYSRDTKPLMVVECKRPDVPLDQAVLDQTIRYNMVLDVRYIVVTNGLSTHIFHKGPEGFVPMTAAPTYKEMIEERD